MTTSFTVTDNAAHRIAQVIERKKAKHAAPPPYGLRITVDSGGCNGFQYQFKLIGRDSVTDEDTTITHDHAHIIIDPLSLPFLEGATLDFAEKLIGAHFAIDNPNAASSCGCGSSFSPV